MISADVLVMAKSCFAYIPAAFSDGIVLYQTFVHIKMPLWKNASKVLVRAEAMTRAESRIVDDTYESDIG